MGAKPRKLDTVRQPILTAYDNGVSLDKIAQAHNVSKGTIRNLLIAEGVSLRTRGRPKGVKNQVVLTVEETQ